MKTIPIEFTEDEINELKNNKLSHHIKRKITIAFLQLNELQFGDRCAFWDDDPQNYTIGILTYIDHTVNDFKYCCEFMNISCWFKNCAKIKCEAEF